MLPRPEPRWHAKGPEWTGDRPSALQLAADEHFEFADQNFQWVYSRLLHEGVRLRVESHGDFDGVAFCMHSETPAENNYRFIVDAQSGHVRPMHFAELHGKVNIVHDAASVYRWRRGPDVDSERPHSLKTHLLAAKHAKVTLVPELKNPAFGHEAVAKQVAATFHEVGACPVVMALAELPGCQQKCEAFISVDAEFLVIYGTDPGHHKRDAARLHIAKTWAVKPTWD